MQSFSFDRIFVGLSRGPSLTLNIEHTVPVLHLIAPTMSSIFVPPTTGKKKARARRVFGEAVVDDAESSLSYSPSPRKASHENTQRCHDDQETSASPSASAGAAKNLSQLEYSDDSTNSNHTSNQSNASVGVDKTSTSSDRSQHTPHSGPFDKIISTTSKRSSSTNKENVTSISDTSTLSGGSLPTKNKPTTRDEAAQERLRQLRMKTRSPLRRDLVKATQAAINNASISVNESLRAAQRAKASSHRHKSKQTARFRKEWKEEAADAKSFYQQAEETRREVLGLHRQLSSKYSKEKANRQLSHRQQQLDQIDRESQFKSHVFRDHQKTLREEEERRRRESIAARAKIRQNNLVGKQKLELQRIEEDQAIFKERHEASVAIRNTTKENADSRRKSFAFRNGDARRIRELHARMQAEQLLARHESYELKWDGEKDAAAYQKHLERERRESLARRNASGRRQRELEREQRDAMLQSEHKSYELKWDGERDADRYRKEVEEQRRKSLAFRNQEGLQQRQKAAEQDTLQAIQEHESYELKWAGEKDAAAYHQRLEEERRASFEQRNLHGRQQREQIEQERSEALSKQHASFELKWAGERDAEDYQKQLARQRRESFASRNQHGKKQRDLQAQEEAEQRFEQHESYELKWAGERDAKAYELRLESERRESLSFRNREGLRQREQAFAEESARLAAGHASYELKWAGEKDAEEYQKQLSKERRTSLAQRNKERLGHANVMEELQTIAREKETESLVLKWAGENDAKAYLAKLEEERRQSLQQRGKQIVHGRQVESQQRFESLQKAHEDELLRAGAQKDVEKYQKACAERDRASLEYRRKEARMQRIQEKDRQIQQQDTEASNFRLESHAHHDVQEYLKECSNRRRLSLAFRAKEKRRHVSWRKKQVDLEQQQRSRDVRDRLADQRHVELARQQERARIAMDAIRHAHCSFNPFSTILNR